MQFVRPRNTYFVQRGPELGIYKPEADGRTLFPFRRLFIVVQHAT